MWITGELVAENFYVMFIIIGKIKMLTIHPLIYKQTLISKMTSAGRIFEGSRQIHIPIY